MRQRYEHVKRGRQRERESEGVCVTHLFQSPRADICAAKIFCVCVCDNFSSHLGLTFVLPKPSLHSVQDGRRGSDMCEIAFRKCGVHNSMCPCVMLESIMLWYKSQESPGL